MLARPWIFAPLLLAVAPVASAIDADPFDPAASLAHATGTLTGESPFLIAEGLAMGLHLNAADDLLVVQYRNAAGETVRTEPVLANTVAATLYGGYTLGDRVRIDGFVPFYALADAPAAPYRSAAFGDVRLQATVPLGASSDAFAFALVPRIELPTGTKRALLHRGPSVALTAAVGGEQGDFGYVANAGVTLSPAENLGNVRMGSTADLLVGGSYRLADPFRVGAEAVASLGLPGDDTHQRNHRTTGNLFAQVSAANGVSLTGGLGSTFFPGLTNIGGPQWRAFAAITYAPLVRDTDGDGYYDDVDTCPLEPEDFDGFQDTDGCPDLDDDADGFPDTSDTCPREAEDFDDYEDMDGCPEADNDADGVLDADDACPLVPGKAEFQGCPDTDGDGLQDTEDACPTEPGPRETQGCPDRDSDLVPDLRDRCPDEPRHPEEDPAESDGCPKRVFITSKDIRITEKVLFDSGKSTIKKESYGLLDEVAQVLTSTPRIGKVEVGGHTDSQGSDALNLKLSDQRAAAVMKYLTDKGVDASRLSSKGFGEGTPIDSNKTAAGRANNRRVEFVILEQTPVVRQVINPPSKPAEPAEPAPASPWGEE